MKKKIRSASLVLFLMFLAGDLPSAPPPDETGMTRAAELEGFLRSAEVVDVKKEITGGRSRPWVVTLARGAVRHRALFKHFDYRRPQPQPHSFKYELAAYELAKLLGVEIVPPVVERKIEGHIGSLQIYIEGCVSEQDRRRKRLEPPDPIAFGKVLDGVRVFESLVNDECMNYGDVLVHTDDWRLCRVDLSEAFGPEPELRKSCPITYCSRQLYDGLLKLDGKAVNSALKSYLSASEIKAILSRRDLLLKTLQALIAQHGEASVLF